MALVLKRIFQGYDYVFVELADKRAERFLLTQSPIPTIVILGLWLMFVLKWGPEYMKDRKPFNLKNIMIAYNVLQVVANSYIVYYLWLGRNIVNWRCTEIDYSNSYWGQLFFWLTYFYFLLKLADLIDTVFLVLRKKSNHLSFLHIYHHAGMVILGWIAAKFIGGGHSYFFGLANCPIHAILYSYYLLTAYDSRFAKFLWLKKCITQAQLIQFGFLIFTYSQIALRRDCKYPKFISFLIVPQNCFMLVLFGDFYIRTYILEPRKRRKELQQKDRDAQEEKCN